MHKRLVQNNSTQFTFYNYAKYTIHIIQLCKVHNSHYTITQSTQFTLYNYTKYTITHSILKYLNNVIHIHQVHW
jgi:hypothetical protein